MAFTGKNRGKFCVVKYFHINNTRGEEVPDTNYLNTHWFRNLWGLTSKLMEVALASSWVLHLPQNKILALLGAKVSSILAGKCHVHIMLCRINKEKPIQLLAGWCWWSFIIHLLVGWTEVGPRTKIAGSRAQMLNHKSCPGKQELNK